MQERSKSALRTAFRQLRQHLDPGQAATDSSMVRERLLNLDRFRQARSVLLYLPTSGEVDTWPLLDHFWKMGNQVLLPRCRPHEPGIMDAYAVTSRHDLAQGSFGLTEPRPDLARLIPQPDPEVVLIPALAFDRRGYRLGFGGGYYDRFLPTLSALTLLIGPAYDFQVLDLLPVDPWDIPVHLIATPKAAITPQPES